MRESMAVAHRRVGGLAFEATARGNAVDVRLEAPRNVGEVLTTVAELGPVDAELLVRTSTGYVGGPTRVLTTVRRLPADRRARCLAALNEVVRDVLLASRGP